MLNQAAQQLLERRKNKAIAVVLGMKERDIDAHLPQHLQDRLRKVVLDQFNEYHELALDVLRSLDTGEVTLNGHYLELLDRIHDEVVGAHA